MPYEAEHLRFGEPTNDYRSGNANLALIETANLPITLLLGDQPHPLSFKILLAPEGGHRQAFNFPGDSSIIFPARWLDPQSATRLEKYSDAISGQGGKKDFSPQLSGYLEGGVLARNVSSDLARRAYTALNIARPEKPRAQEEYVEAIIRTISRGLHMVDNYFQTKAAMFRLGAKSTPSPEAPSLNIDEFIQVAILGVERYASEIAKGGGYPTPTLKIFTAIFPGSQGPGIGEFFTNRLVIASQQFTK